MTDWVILGLVLALLGAAFLLLSAWDKAKWAEMRAEEQAQVAAHIGMSSSMRIGA